MNLVHQKLNYNLDDMNYNNLYADFNSLFPECTEELNALANAADAEETDGMHIMFSFVVIPFILDLLNERVLICHLKF